MTEKVTAVKKPKPSNHYVDNIKFHEEMILFKKEVDAAKAKGLKRRDEGWPVVNNYVGKCFLLIAQHIAHKPNFSGYSFRDEMVSDGVENCLMYADNFDPERKNPFAYFSQIVFYAFIRRIQYEKKILIGKYKYIQNLNIEELLENAEAEGNTDFVNNYVAYLATYVDDTGALAVKPKKEKAVKAVSKKKITKNELTES